MMPIVDPHVGLSRNGFALDDYLTQHEAFHVLRMVAVQSPQQPTAVIEDLHYYRDTSTTRGYGGFPNGMVAYCDLADANLLGELLANDIAAAVRGVHYAPRKDQQSGELQGTSTQLEKALWMQHLDLLNSKGMSLDLSLSISQCELVDTIAKCNADIAVIVTLHDWAKWFDPQHTNWVARQFELMSKHDNVNIKLCGNGCNENNGYASIQKS